MPKEDVARERADGHHGIWFTLGQYDGTHGDKYAGGLGTYTSKHVPMAAYAPAVDRTFFTYGATSAPDEQDLRIAAAAYDHEAHAVSRPTIVDRKPEADDLNDTDTVVDPHDNATLSLDHDGHVWIFVAGRGRRRPARVYRSEEPYSVAGFEFVREWEFCAYPQPWWLEDRLVLCFTIYDESGTRELFWRTSTDGRSWAPPSKLAGIGGHYQVTTAREGEIVTALNWHPDGVPDRRTNLYVLRTADGGESWQAIDGTPIDTPLGSPHNDALAIDYLKRDRLVYLNDVAIDEDGNPVVLYVTSGGPEPGPDNGPRRWQLTRWRDGAWRTETITTSGHNYDSGSLFLEPDRWWVVGPTEPGPQPHYTGGVMAIWRSTDRGRTWDREHVFPVQDGRNATYARRPHPPEAPFEFFWADGDASGPSPSRLYFGSLAGEAWQLPENCSEEWTEPDPLEPEEETD
jgi:hypothetical protein